MTYKILSLDGGGSWAVLQIMALKALFPGGGMGAGGAVTGYDVLRRFDLAIANSGGSIILAGLMLNFTLDQIEALISRVDLRYKLFKALPVGAVMNALLRLPVPKYSSAAKRDGLWAILGDGSQTFMSQLPALPGWPNGPGGKPLRAVIVGFDYDQERATFFRTYGSAHGSVASDVRLLDAVHASSNAPVVFFDKPTECGEGAAARRYWDGAMGGYNNPLMAGVVEAVSHGHPANGIAALTLGTGTTRLAPWYADPPPPAWCVQPKVTPGLLSDAKKAASVITGDPPDAATFTAHVMLGGPAQAMGPVVRMSPVVQPILQDGVWKRPAGLTGPQFDALKILNMDAVAQSDFEQVVILGKAWIDGSVRNQPVRFDSLTLEPEPGDATFAAAAARWRALEAAG